MKLHRQTGLTYGKPRIISQLQPLAAILKHTHFFLSRLEYTIPQESKKIEITFVYLIDYKRKYNNIKQTGNFEAILVMLLTLIIAYIGDTDSVWESDHCSNGQLACTCA